MTHAEESTAPPPHARRWARATRIKPHFREFLRPLLEPGIALYLVSETLDALACTHRLVNPMTGAQLGIVHRDVSPHNVMLSFEGEVKLIDFGLAESALKQEHTESAIVLGKVAYMSPEQGRRAHPRPDPGATAAADPEPAAVDPEPAPAPTPAPKVEPKPAPKPKGPVDKASPPKPQKPPLGKLSISKLKSMIERCDGGRHVCAKRLRGAPHWKTNHSEALRPLLEQCAFTCDGWIYDGRRWRGRGG